MTWKASASAAMDRYARGDDDAFSELYDLLAPRLTTFLRWRTRDPATAEDLVQQTFLQMHGARRHFEPGADVTPWAFAILRRVLIDAHRRSGRDLLVVGTEDGAESAAPGSTPDALAAHRQLARRVGEELANVSQSDRVAFQLVRCDGLSMSEAAELLGTTANAVKLRAHRAYVTLRQMLGARPEKKIA